MEPLQEKIILSVDTSAVKGNSLEKLLGDLRQVEGAIQAIHRAAGAGPTIDAKWVQTPKMIQERLNKAFPQKGPYKAMDVFKAVGLDPANANRAFALMDKLRTKLTGLSVPNGTFNNLQNAAKAVSKIFSEEYRQINEHTRVRRSAIGQALRGEGGASGATLSGKDIAVKVDGAIKLEIPATQIQASVVGGPIQVTVPSAGAPSAGSAVRGPDGRFLPTAPGGGGSKKKSGGSAQPIDLGLQKGETGRILTERLKDGAVTSRQLAVTRVNELGQTVTEIHDSKDGLIKNVERATTGNSPLARYRSLRREMTEIFKQSTLGATDWQMPQVYAQQAGQLRSLAAAQGGKFLHPALAGLPTPVAQQISALLLAGAGTLDARALAEQNALMAPGFAQVAALQGRQTGTMSAYSWRNFLQGGYGINTGMASGPASQMRAYYSQQAATAQRQAAAQARRLARANRAPKNLGSAQWMTPAPYYAKAPLGPFNNPLNPTKPLPPPRMQSPTPNRLAMALGGAFHPENLLVHTIKAAGWATAITAIYKPLELAEHSLKRFVDVGAQTAHLSTVFRGVGGSAQQLANDVMKLAAANGRSTDEAIESATEWARLGMSRVQINEAVKVSLIAANVAQVSVGEATKQMSSLMHIYGLNVGQLDAALGMLVNTSQKFNVTTEDLFGGLDRAAASAKVAGVDLPELQGLIGATSGGIGQSGVQVGNTIKNLLTQFTRPEIQEYLRTQGISTMKGGAYGGGSEVLRQMFIRYQSMNPTQRRSMGTVVAGRLQTARFEGLMNEYPMAQKLAIDGQLRMNAAMETNVKIVQTLRAQFSGLRSEWDRLVVNTDAGGFGGNMGLWTRSTKNVIGGIANLFGGPPDQAAYESALNKNLQGIDYIRRNGGFWANQRENLGMTLATIGYWTGAGFWGENGVAEQPGWMDWYNYNQERGKSNPEQFSQKLGQTLGWQNAYGRMARLFQTATDLGNVHTEASEKTRQFADEYLGNYFHLANGDYAGGQAAAMAASRQQGIEAMKQMAQYKASLDAAYAADGDQKKYQEGMDRLNSATRQVTQSLEEQISTIADMVSRRQEFINLLREEQGVMEILGRLNSQVSPGTLGGETDQKLQTLSQTIPDLERRIAELRDSTGLGQEIESLPQYQQLYSQLQTARSEQSLLTSPRYTAAVEAYDDRRIAIQRAQAEAASSAVGYTESEKLLRQKADLERELGQMHSLGTSASTNDITRAMQLQVELAKNHERIQQRIVELKGEEKQILIDATREYQKSLLLSGPGELLKRLYVGGRSARGGVGAGEFMSMDPESRRFYYDLHGGEPGAKNREEQWLLGGMALSVAGQQGQMHADRSAYRSWLNRLPNPVEGMPGLALPKMDPLMDQAAKSAAALSDFAKQLLTTNDALKTLAQTLGQMNGHASAPSAPANPPPRHNISAGHALGAVSPQANASVMSHLVPTATGYKFQNIHSSY